MRRLFSMSGGSPPPHGGGAATAITWIGPRINPLRRQGSARWNRDFFASFPVHRLEQFHEGGRGLHNIVQVSGKYKLGVHTADVMRLFIDGKKVLEVKPDESQPQTREVSLEAGTHRVELVTAFASEHRVPTVTVQAPGSGAEVSLDDFAANTPASGTAAPGAIPAGR